jgi:hypothetical protein
MKTDLGEPVAPRQATRTRVRMGEIMVRRCEQAFQDSPSLTRWRSHSVRRDIRTDFPWEGRAAAALSSVLRLGSGGRRGVRHSRTRTGPADLPEKNGADSVEPVDDLVSRAPLVYAAIETWFILSEIPVAGSSVTSPPCSDLAERRRYVRDTQASLTTGYRTRRGHQSPWLF